MVIVYLSPAEANLFDVPSGSSAHGKGRGVVTSDPWQLPAQNSPLFRLTLFHHSCCCSPFPAELTSPSLVAPATSGWSPELFQQPCPQDGGFSPGGTEGPAWWQSWLSDTALGVLQALEQPGFKSLTPCMILAITLHPGASVFSSGKWS